MSFLQCPIQKRRVWGGNKVNLINPTKQKQMIWKKPYFERGFIYAEETEYPGNVH